MRPARRLLVKVLVGVVTLLLGACYLTAEAAAGCGGYVQTRGDRSASSPMPDSPQSVEPVDPLTHRSQFPCSGPNCSARDDFPLTSPAPVQDRDDNALLAGGVVLRPTLIAYLGGGLEPRPCPGIHSAIFHPPRGNA